MVMFQGEDRLAESLFIENLKLTRSLKDTRGTVMALIGLGALDNFQGKHDQATPRFNEALSLTDELADRTLAATLAATALLNLGVAVHGLGRLKEATEFHESALSRFRELRDIGGAMRSLVGLGDVARDQGDDRRALDLYRESLSLSPAQSELRLIVDALTGVAAMAVAGGHAERAARLFGAADALRERGGITISLPADRAALDRGVSATRAGLTAGAFDAAWLAGRTMSLDQAMAAALEPFEMEPDKPASGLTRRESDVLRLLVAGQTDREIAEALFMGRRTAQWHVANILEKLGVRTRAAAVAAAVTNGLVDPPPSPPRPPR